MTSRTEIQDGRLTVAEFGEIIAATGEADTLMQQKQFEKARQILEEVIRKKPDYVRPWSMLGFIHASEDRLAEAVSCFATAHYLCPLNAAILLDLAKAQSRHMLGEAALVSLQKCNQIAPDNVDILLLMGDQYWSEGDIDRSAQAFENALKIDAGNARAILGLALAHQDRGDMAESAALYREVLGLPDTSQHRKFKFQAAYCLADMGEDISKQEIVGNANPDGDASDKRYLNFAMACLYFNRGICEQAWNHVVAANQSAREAGQIADDRNLQRYALALEYANAMVIPSDTNGIPDSGPNLIFVVGASRSGKTTLELCLAHNADVQPTYEMATMDRAVLRVAQVLGMPNIVDPWFMDDVPDDVLRNVFTDYVRGICKGKPHLTNTNPINISYIGLVARLVPSAKFVFIKRDRTDQAFRIYLYNYHHGNGYSTDLTTIDQYIDWYEEMIDVWMAKIPERCMLVTYEGLVQDPASTLASVAGFTGVEIDLSDIQIGDDRGCGEPFRQFMQKAKSRD